MIQDLDQFLASDWRNRPHFFPAAVDVSALQVSLASLASLATDDLVESRLVNAEGDVIHGPFEAADPDDNLLPDGYMLMVQCLEQHLPEIDRLLKDSFGFLPRWQIDDVMASIGNSGTSCGAHFDRYDVFLLQVQGEKRWLLDEAAHAEDELRTDVDARLLEAFEPTMEFIARPGDVLYIPPGAGHLGQCEGESLTLSVGIRNPSMAEVLADLGSETLATSDLSTPLEQVLHRQSGIPVEVAGQLKSELNQLLDRETLLFWYGCYVTRLREPELIQPLESLEKTDRLVAALPSRIACSGQGNLQQTDTCFLFVNGDGYVIEPGDLAVVSQLADEREIDYPTHASATPIEIIDELVEAGALYFVS